MPHYRLNTPIGRFRVQTFAEDADRCVASIPLAGLVSPVTGLPSMSPLAVLIDHVGGMANHHRRRRDHQWTVSSELTLELTPDAASIVAASGDIPVHAVSRPMGAQDATAVCGCQLSIGDVVIGSGLVRSFYIEAPAEFVEFPVTDESMEAKFGLADMMATGAPHVDGDAVVLPQRADAVLNNSIGVMHGGVASAGLEVVAAAALNQGRFDTPLSTASLRVNFLRPFLAGAESRYVGTAFRVGRRSGVAEAQATGSDGKLALIARLTAYRP